MKKESELRLEKLEKIIKMGIDPFPSDIKQKQEIAQILEKKEGSFNIVGKIMSIRAHGKSTFIDIIDASGKIQVYFKADEIGENNYNLLKLIDNGDYIEVSGELFTTKAGELTLSAKKFRIVCKTLSPLPDKWFGLKDMELRYRKRPLDLIMNPKVKKSLKTRSKIVSTLREFMNKKGFLEVETPILQPIPGGAAAKPFITHYNILDQDMYLRIAPELYLKRLIVGGFEKVFEIGRNFRNEGLSHMHNPEFTSMEFYWAYQDYKSLMKFTENMIEYVTKKIKKKLEIEFQGKKINLKTPYKVTAFDELIKRDSSIDIYKHLNFEDLKKEVEKNKIELDFSQIKTWPKLVDELYKKVSRPKIIEPIFVIDHPIILTPLAKAKECDEKKAQRFQLVLAGGIELVNAYTEQNNPVEQEKSLEVQIDLRKSGYEEGEMLDKSYVEALSYGLPPTAGWGMGIERLAMLLTDNYSIKEVIPFPTLKKKEGRAL